MRTPCHGQRDLATLIYTLVGKKKTKNVKPGDRISISQLKKGDILQQVAAVTKLLMNTSVCHFYLFVYLAPASIRQPKLRGCQPTKLLTTSIHALTYLQSWIHMGRKWQACLLFHLHMTFFEFQVKFTSSDVGAECMCVPGVSSLSDVIFAALEWGF